MRTREPRHEEIAWNHRGRRVTSKESGSRFSSGLMPVTLSPPWVSSRKEQDSAGRWLRRLSKTMQVYTDPQNWSTHTHLRWADVLSFFNWHLVKVVWFCVSLSYSVLLCIPPFLVGWFYVNAVLGSESVHWPSSKSFTHLMTLSNRCHPISSFQMQFLRSAGVGSWNLSLHS